MTEITSRLAIPTQRAAVPAMGCKRQAKMSCFPPARRLLVAAALASLTLAGCACDEANWKTEVVSLTGPPNCAFNSLEHRSKASANLVERADPKLLEIARLEAERDCYKAAEARARKRIEL